MLANLRATKGASPTGGANFRGDIFERILDVANDRCWPSAVDANHKRDKQEGWIKQHETGLPSSFFLVPTGLEKVRKAELALVPTRVKRVSRRDILNAAIELTLVKLEANVFNEVIRLRSSTCSPA